MSQQSDEDVQVDIQKTLIAINNLTLKIKKELTAISDLVREKGRLDVTVNEANEALAEAARKAGVDLTKDPIDGDEDMEESENLLLPKTSIIISQRIMSLLNGSQSQSQ